MTPREQREAEAARKLTDLVEQLRIERHVKRVKLETVGADLDVGHSAISCWENRERDPTSENLLMWADNLGFEVVLRRKFASNTATPKKSPEDFA